MESAENAIKPGFKARVIAAALSLAVGSDRKKAAEATRITSPEGIYSMEKVEIGGIPQWVQIRGQNRLNPVMLMLHGGPGTAVTTISHIYQLEWEQKYTMVNWDQRGCGLTSRETPLEDVIPTITMERMVEDAHEVVLYIRKKLGVDKIVLLGQSWGTCLGTQLALKYPELFTAYIGMGQLVNVRRNMRLGAEHVLEFLKESGNKKLYDRLYAADVRYQAGEIFYFDEEFWTPYATALNLCGGASTHYRKRKVMQWAMLRAMLTSPETTPLEVVTGELGKHVDPYDALSRGELDEFDLFARSAKYEVPYYQLNGDTDWQTPYPLAHEYFELVKAPHKRWFTIRDAGHISQLDNNDDITKYLCDDIYNELFGGGHAS